MIQLEKMLQSHRAMSQHIYNRVYDFILKKKVFLTFRKLLSYCPIRLLSDNLQIVLHNKIQYRTAFQVANLAIYGPKELVYGRQVSMLVIKYELQSNTTSCLYYNCLYYDKS